jgi:hypothetical protein
VEANWVGGSHLRFDLVAGSVWPYAAAVVLCGRGPQVADSHQVVNRQRKGEHPADPRDAAMASLAQASNGLEPTEDLFDPFALALTNRVAGMARGACVDSAVGLARDVRRDLKQGEVSLCCGIRDPDGFVVVLAGPDGKT